MGDSVPPSCLLLAEPPSWDLGWVDPPLSPILCLCQDKGGDNARLHLTQRSNALLGAAGATITTTDAWEVGSERSPRGCEGHQGQARESRDPRLWGEGQEREEHRAAYLKCHSGTCRAAWEQGCEHVLTQRGELHLRQ